MTISFGTDGWRAVISDTFTFNNLRLLTQAIADAVASESWTNGSDSQGNPDGKRMVVGFDTRFLSDRYATDVSRVLAGNGFTTFISQGDAPTPAISYAVKNMNAVAGIMITASHNAPRYNGIKLKAAFGGSALPEQCRKVEIFLNDNEAQARGPNLMDYQQAKELKLIQKFNPISAYGEHLKQLIDFDIIADNAVLYPVVHVKTVSASWDDPSTAPNGEALDGFKGIGTTSMSFRGVATVKA